MAFLGIRIPHEIGRLLSQIDVPGEKTSTSELHVTLLYFGDEWPISEISKSLEAAYDVVSDFHPFLAKMEKISSFPKNPEGKVPVICRVESDELHKLRDKLAEKFDEEGIEFSKLHKDFKPHVTLAYANDEPEETKFHPLEFSISEIVLWGGDHGDDRIFVTFPLAGPSFDKNALLLKKIEVFDKIAGNPLQDFFTPTKERRKIERFAQQGEDARMQQYKEDLEELTLTHWERGQESDMAEFIRAYHDVLRNRPEDLKAVTDAVESYFIYGYGSEVDAHAWVLSLNQVDPSIAAYLVKHIHDVILNMWNSQRLSVESLISWEDFFTEAEIRKAFIGHVQEFRKFLEENESDRALRDLIGDLGAFSHSKKLPRDAILRLIRQYSLPLFGRLYGKKFRKFEEGEATYKEFLKKSRYDVNDIVFLVEEYTERFGIMYKNLQHIISKSSDQAKDLLQSVLWWKQPTTMFMLQSDMTPVTISFGKVEDLHIDSSEMVHPASLVNVDAYPDWVQYMHDHKIIPYQNTFAKWEEKSDAEED